MLNLVAHINDKMETIQIIHHCHIKGSRDGAFFIVSSHSEVSFISLVDQLIDQMWYAVEGKDDGLLGSEDAVKLTIGQSQVDHVNKQSESSVPGVTSLRVLCSMTDYTHS